MLQLGLQTATSTHWLTTAIETANNEQPNR
jgi:hypothetical protein